MKAYRYVRGLLFYTRTAYRVYMDFTETPIMKPVIKSIVLSELLNLLRLS